MSMDNQSTEIARLYEDSRSALTGYFTRRHGSAQGVEDLLQETFLRLVRHAKRLAHARSPRAYVFGIARHVSADTFRKSAPRAAGAETIENVPAPIPDPRLAAVREILVTLPSLQREILDLRFQHDLSYIEIADVLDVPVGTVRSRLHNAILMLREKWAQEEDVPRRRCGDE